jgi:hypothetical protein
MNQFTDIVFIFVFVFVLLHFELINIKNSNIVSQKLLMFIYVTAFATMLNIMKSIRCKIPIDMWNAVADGIIIGMLAYIGHTMLYDMWYMESTRKWIESWVDETYLTLNVLLTISVVMAVTIGKATKIIFSTETCN